MPSEAIFFSVFLGIVVVILIFDLGLFNKRDHIISYREALAWTVLWITLALGWYGYLSIAGEKLHNINTMASLQEIVTKHHHAVIIDPDNFDISIAAYRKAISLEFITGYLIEYSLSVDNIFVIIVIFSAFSVEKRLFHKVLFWGILGAVLFRFIFIFAGGFLIDKYGWILYVFAVFLIYTGVKMFLTRNETEVIDVEHHPVVKYASRIFRVHKKFEGNKFFFLKDAKKYITPLFLVLLVIEFTDIIFAVDSIPAIFAVTRDTYIVFFSNIFAILGLRTMFFLLINIVDKLRYFKHGLSALLVFIGIKMLFEEHLKEFGFTSIHSLMVILSILGLSILFSFLFPAAPLEHDGKKN